MFEKSQEITRDNIIDEILMGLKARYSLIWIMSSEESRVLEILADVSHKWKSDAYVCEEAKTITPIFEWVKERPYFKSIECPIGNVNVGESFSKIYNSMNKLKDNKYLFIYPDFHFVTNQSLNDYKKLVRYLKLLEARLRSIDTSLIFISQDFELPKELENIIHVVDLPYPELTELMDELEYILYPYEEDDIPKDFKIKISSYAKGLTLKHASRIFSLLIASGEEKSNWINIIASNKQTIMKKSGALEYFPPRSLPSKLGGLKILKKKLDLYQNAFDAEAREFGVEYPKGIALIGIPGTGKSLTAKYIAKRWKMPLLRLDMGAIFGGIVGESERNMREAIKMAEAVAPCILWIDEIEKVTQTKGLDAGTSSRVFATFLTWMQEKTRPVFVLATANDVKYIPPELLRKGRFDETFFLDIPLPREREEIFKIHLKKRKKNPRDFKIKKLVKITEGFVGAEIEQIIKEVLLIAYSEKREPKIDDFQNLTDSLIPLKISQEKKIKKLRKWVKEKRAINASESAEKKMGGIQRPKI